MSYRPKIKNNASGALTDLALDASTIDGIPSSDIVTKTLLNSGLTTGGNIIFNDRLIVNATSDLVGDLYVGQWNHSGGSVTPGATQASLRVNGTLTTTGEINTNGHSISVGAINCDEIEAGNSTVYCGNIFCGEISGSTAYLGNTSLSSLSVSGTTSLSGNITCSGTFSGYDASYSGSVTVGGTLRANNDLKTSSVYPSESNKKNLGKSNYLYRHSYITEMHTDKITSLTNTETYIDPTTGEPATRNVFVTMPLASGVITTDESLATVAKTGSYNDLSNKPTIPATNVIPATTTANKLLVSTTTSGTSKWSDFSTAGFLKTNTSGVISVDTNTYLTTSGTAANSSKLGNVDASNYIQKSSTAGLVKNDGTIDTTAYSTFTGYTSTNKLSTNYINNVAGWTSNAGTVTSVRVQAGTGLSSSTSTAQTSTLNTTISIASGYKLPTTTEWNGKQNTLSSTNKLSSSYISWDGDIDLSNDPEGHHLTNVGGYGSSNLNFAIDVDGWMYYTNGNPMSIQETHGGKTITLLTDDSEVRTKNTSYTFKEDGLYLDSTKITYTLGTTSTTAAAGNHTHTLSLTSGGTSTINLAANTAYTLTAGGNSIVFKTPAAGGSSNIKVDGITSSNSTITRYATCNTSGSTAAKTATINAGTFTLETGARVTVTFTNRNSALYPTLNINSTGAKSIRYKTSNGDFNTIWRATALFGTMDLVYNGTVWIIVSPTLLSEGTITWSGNYEQMYDILESTHSANFLVYEDNSDGDEEDKTYYPCIVSANLYYDGETSNVYNGYIKWFTGSGWANVSLGSTIKYKITI